MKCLKFNKKKIELLAIVIIYGVISLLSNVYFILCGIEEGICYIYGSCSFISYKMVLLAFICVGALTAFIYYIHKLIKWDDTNKESACDVCDGGSAL